MVHIRVITKKISMIFLYLAFFWIIIGFILEPMLNTFLKSLNLEESYSFKNYINYFMNPNSRLVLLNTFKLGIFTVLVCGIIGTTLGIYLTFVDIKLKKIIHLLLLSPIMVPGVIIVISFIQLYGESGMITKGFEFLTNSKVFYNFSGFGGILFVHAYTQYVYFYLNVSISLKYLDYATVDAARGLGASDFKILRTVIIPAIMPALFSSSIVTFISGISSFSAPNLLGGYKVLSTQIMLSKANNQMHMASTQVVLLMFMGLSVLFLLRYYEKKHSQESNIRRTPIEKRTIQNPLTRYLINCFMGIIITLIVLPVGCVVFLSFANSSSMMMDIFPQSFSVDNYMKIFTKKRVLRPFANSIVMSFQAVAIGLIISIPVAYLSTKKKNKLNSLVELLFLLPWAMPVSTIAINLINSFNKSNIFAFNNVLIGGYFILPIAYILVSLPLLLKSNILAMESFNSNLENASSSLGASRFTTFQKIIVPIISPGILAGSSLVFIRSIGEYTMSALLYGVHNKPLSIAMVTAMQEFDIGLSMAYGTLTILICFSMLLLIIKLDTKRYT